MSHQATVPGENTSEITLNVPLDAADARMTVDVHTQDRAKFDRMVANHGAPEVRRFDHEDGTLNFLTATVTLDGLAVTLYWGPHYEDLGVGTAAKTTAYA